MGVPEGKRKENRLEVWLAAVRLTKYTMEITSNKRSFPGRYGAMTDRICGRAWDVQTRLWEANNIWVGQGCPRENVEARRHLQDMAVAGLRALLVDVSGYYPNMRHDVATSCLARRLDPWSLSLAGQILDVQGSGDVGYDPGSQLVQLVGISVLSPLDHMVKERLRARRYVRYMDDMVLVLPTREEAERALSAITVELARIGYETNRRKTRVQPLSEPVPFLGFTFLLRPTGYVLVRMRSERVRDARRRLRRVAEAAAAGRVSAGKADEIAQTAIRYMLANCSDRATPRKVGAYWDELRREFT